jgi:hypothetical protein
MIAQKDNTRGKRRTGAAKPIYHNHSAIGCFYESIVNQSKTILKPSCQKTAFAIYNAKHSLIQKD